MVASIGPDDDWREVRAIDPGYLPPLKPASPFPATSTLGPAKPLDVLLTHRPQLPHPMRPLLGILTRLEEQADTDAGLLETENNQDLAEIQRINEEKQDLVRKQAESVEKRNSWGILTNVSQYLLSAASIVLGISCLATAQPAGVLLIISGATGLANRVALDLGLYERIAACFAREEALQKTIATRIEMGMFFLSLSLGLAGGFLAGDALRQAANLTTNENIVRIATQFIGLASSITGVVSRLGSAFHDRNIAHLQAEMQLMETAAARLNQDMTQRVSTTQRSIEIVESYTTDVQHAISAFAGG